MKKGNVPKKPKSQSITDYLIEPLKSDEYMDNPKTAVSESLHRMTAIYPRLSLKHLQRYRYGPRYLIILFEFKTALDRSEWFDARTRLWELLTRYGSAEDKVNLYSLIQIGGECIWTT